MRDRHRPEPHPCPDSPTLQDHLLTLAAARTYATELDTLAARATWASELTTRPMNLGRGYLGREI